MTGYIKVNGLKFKLPVKPSKKDILFSDLKKKNQKWRRTEMPEGLNEDTVPKYSWFTIFKSEFLFPIVKVLIFLFKLIFLKIFERDISLS